MSPEEIVDRTEACQQLGISRQTLLSWIRKGKLKVWKRVGHGSNAALLFERAHIQDLVNKKQTNTINEQENLMSINKVSHVVVAVVMSILISTQSWAVGSSGLSTQLAGVRALGQGNAFAGQADDPSATYYNPAGITQLSGTQISIGGVGLIPMTKRSGNSVADDQIKKQLAFTPNFYLTSRSSLNEKLAYGVGLNSPFGLTTEWAPTSSVAYLSTISKFEMVNVNPNIAYQVLPELSLAAGADYVNLFNTVSQSQVPQSVLNGNDGSPDGTSKLCGHGSGWGYNVAALYKPAESHALGLSYRSQVRVPIKGQVELTDLVANTQSNYNFASAKYTADATSSFIIPASILFGYKYKANSKWTLLADYEWTQWNVFQKQDVAINENDPNRLTLLTGSSSSNVSSTVRNWHNTSAFGLGANYAFNDSWEYRGGYAFYEKTVPNDAFIPDIPDATSHLISLGITKRWGSYVLDGAFNGYIYVNRNIRNSVGSAISASVNGKYSTFVPALALSLTYKFGA